MSTSREYKSTLRQERARETRLQIRRSARNLFSSQGFGRTTITQIAKDAGVSPQTIYAVFGSKGAIVKSMIDDLEESVGMDALVDRMYAQDDPRTRLRAFVSIVRKLFEVGAPILRAVLASTETLDVGYIAGRGNENRRKGAGDLVKTLSFDRALARGLKIEDAADRLWLLCSPEQYFLAVDYLGWTPDRYERWLGDILDRELLEREMS